MRPARLAGAMDAASRSPRRDALATGRAHGVDQRGRSRALTARGESRSGSHALPSRAPHAIAQVDCSGAETSHLKEFEIPSYGGSECRLSAADDHRVEKQVTFVDEIGFERKSRQLGAADEDVVLRFALQLPSRLGIELPLDTRDACRSPCQRSREDDLL